MSGQDDESLEWDAYSDYNQVANSVTNEIHKATRAAGLIQRYHNDGGRFDSREIAESAAYIQSATMMLDEQLHYFSGSESSDEDTHQQILDKWRGDNGRISKMQETDFVHECPDWLPDLVRELYRAGLLLGYLKAGRVEEMEEDGDAEDSEVMAVIEEMTL